MPIEFIDRIPVDDQGNLILEHAEYRARDEQWVELAALLEGGRAVQIHADSLLYSRPKEPQEIWRQRRQRIVYENVFGQIVGWYSARMFSDPLEITTLGEDKEPIEDDKDEFWASFMRNADGERQTFSQVWQEAYRIALAQQRSFVLIDLPQLEEGEAPPETLADEKQMGLDRPFLRVYNPISVPAWSQNATGKLEWIIFRSQFWKQEGLRKGEMVDQWTVFDETQTARYERVKQVAGTTSGGQAEYAERVTDPTPHATASLNTPPVVWLEMPKEYWIGGRVWLPVKAHLNSLNALNWALFMGAMAMPVITSDEDPGQQKGSETAYIWLSPNSKMEWSEPEGKSWEHIRREKESFREEIFRLAYLLSQARTSEATPAAQSGLSKQQDVLPVLDVLQGMAEVLRPAMAHSLDLIAGARGGGKRVHEVSGEDFNDQEDMGDLEIHEKQLSLEIQSDTYSKEAQKQAAAYVLRNRPKETIEKTWAEIEAAPSKEDMEQRERDEKRETMELALRAKTEAGGSGAQNRNADT